MNLIKLQYTQREDSFLFFFILPPISFCLCLSLSPSLFVFVLATAFYFLLCKLILCAATAFFLAV